MECELEPRTENTSTCGNIYHCHGDVHVFSVLGASSPITLIKIRAHACQSRSESVHFRKLCTGTPCMYISKLFWTSTIEVMLHCARGSGKSANANPSTFAVLENTTRVINMPKEISAAYNLLLSRKYTFPSFDAEIIQ